jgi:O-antigen/teichoic acid export membrane protein
MNETTETEVMVEVVGRPTEAGVPEAGSAEPPMHRAEHHKRLLHRGAINAFAVSVLGAGAGFGAHVIVARAVGKSEYGIYGLMLSWVSVLAVIAQAGQDNNVVRLLPAYSARGEWGKAKGLRYGAGALVLLLSIVIAVVGCAVVAIAGRQQSVLWRQTFYIGFAMLPILTQLQQSGAMHRAFKRAIGANAYVTVGRPVALIAIMAPVMVYVHPVGAPIAAAASALSTAVALALSTAHMSWAWPVEARGVRPQYEMTHWASMGLRMCILSWMLVATSRVDVLLLGALMGASDVGPYYAAVNIAGFAFYAFQAVNVILAPLIAEQYDTGDLRGLEALVRRGARFGLLGGVVTTVSIAVIGHWTLGVFGPGFAAAYHPLLVLLCGYCAVTVIGPGGFVLSMTKYQRQASGFAGVGFVVNAVLTTILAPRYGALGAALSAAIQLVIWHSLMLRFVITRLGINSSAFGPSLAGRARA